LLGPNWEKQKKKSTLIFSTSSPLEKSDYKVQLEQASTALTKEMYLDATTELDFLQTELELNDSFLSTEVLSRATSNMN
jgi:hypothetical protein